MNNQPYTQEKDIEWLDSHLRITRRCLIGTGIVCGLDVWTDENYTVHICHGLGVTSHGHLIQQQQAELLFRYYKPYNDTTNYSFFKNSSGEPYSLWQLIENHEEAALPLAPRNLEETNQPFLNGKVVVAYLEPLESTVDSTIIPAFKVLYLLMRQEDLLTILNLEAQVRRILNARDVEEDWIFSESFSQEDERPMESDIYRALHPSLLLNEVSLRRFGFSAGDPHDCPPDEVDISVFPSIKSLDNIYKVYVPLIDEAAEALERELLKVNDLYKTLYYSTNSLDSGELITQLRQKWTLYKSMNEVTTLSRKEYIQYFYDWLRDLIHAYHELRLEMIELIVVCCNNSELYSRHVLLGFAKRDGLRQTPSPLRHSFERPPIYNDNAKVKLYFWRILMMIRGFYLPGYINDKTLNPYCAPQEDEDMPPPPDFSKIKITPGRFYDHSLGSQTIPFYYLLSLGKYSMHRFWDYHRVKTDTIDRILSYHANDSDDSYSNLPPVVRTLHYNLDNYPFFRIEGHIGKIVEADNVEIPQLTYLKRKYNLPFDIVYKNVNELTTQFDEIEPVGGILKFNTFKAELLGMEHLAGVKEAGTFVVVYEKNKEGQNIAIADFSLPYRCCPIQDRGMLRAASSTTPASVALTQTRTASPVTIKDQLINKIGKATPAEKDNLTVLKGIGGKVEKDFNELGIFTFQQLSKLEEEDYLLLDQLLPGVRSKNKVAEWVKEAKKRTT